MHNDICARFLKPKEAYCNHRKGKRAAAARGVAAATRAMHVGREATMHEGGVGGGDGI